MSVTPLVFAILFGLVFAVEFLVGLRFYLMSEPPAGASVEQVRRFGRLMMMGATAMLFFLAAVIVHGDLPITAKG
jgi:hypothetical protein